MIPNSTSPTPIRTVEEQLRYLYRRRSVVDQLISTLKIYQRLKPGRAPKSHRVA